MKRSRLILEDKDKGGYQFVGHIIEKEGTS